ncbi:hypothetical protein ACKWTF_013512 [Chironomus riparius]
MTWMWKLQAYEKFLNFNGCELVLMLPFLYKSELTTYHWGISYLDANDNEIKTHGITPAIFKMAANKFNFIDSYCPTDVYDADWIRDFNLKRIYPFGYNKTFKHPNVFFDILSTSLYDNSKIRMSNSFMNIKINLLLSSFRTYKPHEKLFMIFDLTTWILFGATLMTIFCGFLIIDWIFKVIYIKHQFQLDGACLFFGILNIKVSSWKSIKILLLFSTLYYLQFRILYQNISYSFLTLEPDSIPINSLEYLVREDFTVKTLFREEMLNVIGKNLKNW